jgi:hypothetical protein
VTNRFGQRLYQTFFKSYTEKVWGIPCTQIRADWAAQRIQGLSLKKAVINAFFGANDTKTLIKEFDYPLLGPGMMWEKCQEIVTNKGGKVHLNTTVDRIYHQDRQIQKISVRQKNQTFDLQADHFINQEYVFSGHFHKRQSKGSITYIGNCFPHNYADAGDDDRGMMLLEWGGKPEYHTWPGQPTFRTYKLSQIIDRPDELLRERMHCRVTIDLPISFEEANFIKETFMPQYKLRELMLIPEKVEIESGNAPIDINFESVDTIVMNQINAIDSDTFDKGLLLEIYREL